jgi:hypothetical protein
MFHQLRASEERRDLTLHGDRFFRSCPKIEKLSQKKPPKIKIQVQMWFPPSPHIEYVPIFFSTFVRTFTKERFIGIKYFLEGQVKIKK